VALANSGHAADVVLKIGGTSSVSGINNIPNAATTGTTLNSLAKLTGAPATAVISTTTDLSGLLGIVIGGAGTTGNVQIATGGIANCTFDGATTARDYVQASTTTGGDCHDAGATYPTANQILGRVQSTNGAGGLYPVLVFPSEIVPAAGSGSGTVTSVAQTVPAWLTVTGSPVTTAGTLAITGTSETANEVLASPNGSAGAMTPRALVGADLPNPSASTLGGIESLAATSHEWINAISTAGVPAATQPAFTDISGVATGAQLPNPSASTLGGVESFAAVTNEFLTGLSTGGVFSAAQPAFSNLSGSATLSQVPPVIYQHTLTETAGAATMVVQSSTVPLFDDDTIAVTAPLTVTTFVSTGAAAGDRLRLRVTTSGTSYGVTFAAGTGVTLLDSTAGSAGHAVGSMCGVPATGFTDYFFLWDGVNLTLTGCAPNPPTPVGALSGGLGTGTAPTSGQVPVGQSNGTYAPESMSGNCTISSSGVITCTPAGQTFGLGFDFIGTPTASMIEAFTTPYTMNVPANYATPTSVCTCGTTPSETDAYTVKCNGTPEGTFSLSTTCVLTLPTNSAYACTAGQRMEMDAPATVSGKDIACTVAFTR